MKDLRSHIVITDKGTTICRNKRDGLKVPDNMNLANDYNDIDSEDDDISMPEQEQQRESDNVYVAIPEIPTTKMIGMLEGQHT